jgi:hypothetical protein
MEELNSNGFLLVKVSTANGAIPIENASIIIQGKDENNQEILISLLTDRDGLSPKITLPAPPSDLSQAPSPDKKPYSIYNIDIFKEGYYPQHYNGVPIFQNVTAVQNAHIIPFAEPDSLNPYTNKGQIFDEYENPNLYK